MVMIYLPLRNAMVDSTELQDVAKASGFARALSIFRACSQGRAIDYPDRCPTFALTK
jgi:hypothetical protein